MIFKDVGSWNNRWQAINGAIENVFNTLPNAAGIDRRSTLDSTLKCLQAFGQRQYEYFRDGFTNNPPTLATTSKFSAEYALRHTLDQIAFDLAILQRARNQRTHAITTVAERETLARADNLAYKALIPAIETNLIENTTVLTYFQKSPSVRIVPYAHIALIGIPFTCLDIQNNAQDFLAIPHEIGHHVFWHGRKNGLSLRTSLGTSLPDNLPVWAANWLEEIFADVYGCYIAGPVIAYDFQELLFDNLNFAKDDGKHPIPVVRPYIYTNTLSKITTPANVSLFNNAPQLLAGNWNIWKQERYNTNTIQPMGETNPLTIQYVNQQLGIIIDTILDNGILQQPNNVADLWSPDTVTIRDQYGPFFNNFLTAIPRATQNNVPEIISNGNSPQLTIDPVATLPDVQQMQWNAGETNAIWFEFLDKIAPGGTPLPANVWSELFTNGGWVVGGPESDDNPG